METFFNPVCQAEIFLRNKPLKWESLSLRKDKRIHDLEKKSEWETLQFLKHYFTFNQSEMACRARKRGFSLIENPCYSVNGVYISVHRSPCPDLPRY